MRLAYLASRDSIHTVRWVNAMADRGHEVHILTMQPGGDPLRHNVREHHLPIRHAAGYVLNTLAVRQILRAIVPDVLHVHYASGYGTLARLSGFHPYVLSVYGSDVYDFPMKSTIRRRIIERNLQTPDWLCSTSEVMAGQTEWLLKGHVRDITVTPFGIDVDQFSPVDTGEERATINIGIIKKLDPRYGIDVLIRAFAIVRDTLLERRPQDGRRLRLTIVGRGPRRTELERLVAQLGLTDVTTFSGRIAHDEVPTYLNELDVYVAPSRSESFGVAILEASACGVPVVVAKVGGLPEVVKDGETGFIIQPDDVDGFASAILRIVEDPDLGKRLGQAGRQYVLERYRWEDCVSIVEGVLTRIANGEPVREAS